jgi:hypothetical protein
VDGIGREGRPFGSAQAAWLWAMEEIARREGGRSHVERPSGRPCSPDDLVRIVARLSDAGGLSARQIAVLTEYGAAGAAPIPGRASAEHVRLWDAAMSRIATELRRKGIVR